MADTNWNGPRIKAIFETNNIFGQLIVNRPLDRGYHQRMLQMQQHALDTINFLCNEADRSQVMQGRPRAAVAPNGRAAVL